MGTFLNVEIVKGKNNVKDMRKIFDQLIDSAPIKNGDNPCNGTFSTNTGASIPEGFDTTPIPDYLADYITGIHWEGKQNYLRPHDSGQKFKKWGRVVALPVKYTASRESGKACGKQGENEYNVAGIRVSTSDIKAVFADREKTHLQLFLNLKDGEIRKKIEAKINAFKKESANNIAGTDSASPSKVYVIDISFEFPGLEDHEIRSARNLLINLKADGAVPFSRIVGERNTTVKIKIRAGYSDNEMETETGWMFSGICATD